MLFKEFCEDEVAKLCSLTSAQVFVLPFYTTWGFVSIDGHLSLRDKDLVDRKESHKLALTVYTLSKCRCEGH